MVKQHTLSRADQILFIIGSISVTLIAAFIANGFFKGHIELLLIEAILYIAIVFMYIQTFRTSRTKILVQFSRAISYASVIAAILIVFFIAYFVTTFRW